MRTITVPITLASLNDDGFHLMVEIGLFGKKCRAVVDTGASRTVFDRKLIEQHVEEVFTSEDNGTTTLFTTSQMIQAIVPKFKIGKLIIKKYHAVGLDLDSVNMAYAEMGHPRIDAILGSDIFYDYQAKINYKKLTLTLNSK